MAGSQYTFLPWTRRGLAARTPVLMTGSLPPPARVDVGGTLTRLTASTFTLTVNGPGDVLGIDPRVVVRTEPRPNTDDVEPNYLALVEFDAPDLPWLFTPASSGTDDRLPPWCVLVVVDLAVLAHPSREAGRPLPVLTVPHDLVATELPDLAESWAWAHTQLIAPDGEDPGAALHAGGTRPWRSAAAAARTGQAVCRLPGPGLRRRGGRRPRWRSGPDRPVASGLARTGHRCGRAAGLSALGVRYQRNRG